MYVLHSCIKGLVDCRSSLYFVTHFAIFTSYLFDHFNLCFTAINFIDNMLTSY